MFYSYGLKTNRRFLLSYGFTIDNNYSESNEYLNELQVILTFSPKEKDLSRSNPSTRILSFLFQQFYSGMHMKEEDDELETHCQCLYFLSTNHLHQRTLLLYQAISLLFSSFCIVSFIVVLAFILLLRWWALWDLSMLGGGRGFSAFVVSLHSHFIGQWTFGSRVPLVLLPVFLSLITLRG